MAEILLGKLTRREFRQRMAEGELQACILPLAATEQHLDLSYWDVLTEEDARQLMTSGSRLPEDLPGHAQEFETSIALAQFAENVRNDVLPDQADRTPVAASAAIGQEWLERVVDRVSDHLRAMLAGERVVAVPPFHP